jgi:hypothetical protein
VAVTDTQQRELWRQPVLTLGRVHGLHGCWWPQGTAAAAAGQHGHHLLLLAVWGGCELQVLWLRVAASGSGSQPSSSSSSSSPSRACTCVHRELLPRTDFWVLDAVLLPPCEQPPCEQQQQQLLLLLSMDNAVAVWSLQPAQGAAQAAGGARCRHTARIACDSRASLYSGALLVLPPGQRHQQPQTAVWVASGTAFGEILAWQLPRAALAPQQQLESQAPLNTVPTQLEARVQLRLNGHEGSVHRVTWGPALAAGNGTSSTRLLGSGSDDRSARIWRLPLSTWSDGSGSGSGSGIQGVTLLAPHTSL